MCAYWGVRAVGTALHECHSDRRHRKACISGKGQLISTAASQSMLPPELGDFGIAPVWYFMTRYMTKDELASSEWYHKIVALRQSVLWTMGWEHRHGWVTVPVNHWAKRDIEACCEEHGGFQTFFTVTEDFYQENVLQKIQYIKPKGVEQCALCCLKLLCLW